MADTPKSTPLPENPEAEVHAEAEAEPTSVPDTSPDMPETEPDLTEADAAEEEPSEPVWEYYQLLPPEQDDTDCYAIEYYEEPEPTKWQQFRERTAAFFDSIAWDKIVMRLIAAFFASSAYAYFQLTFTEHSVDFTSLDFVRQSSMPQVLIGILLVFLLLSTVSLTAQRIHTDAYAMAIAVTSYAFLTLWKNDDFYYMLGVVVVLGAFLYYLLKNDCLKELYEIRGWKSFLIILLGSGIMCAFVGILCVVRYWIYYGSCFDLGIAGQMYYYMKETFQQATTCERDQLLSHFAVHFTPVYYLLLPVYCIWPYLETLLVAQPIILALGVIPLYLICKHYGFKPVEATCMSLAYVLSCAIISPCFYDFHENAFIPVLMLWFFYFMEKRQWKRMYLFMLLTLSCKEDVSVSVCCIGLYLLLSNRGNKKVQAHGFLIAAFSAFYFLVVTSLLAKYGEGTFSHRFNSLMADPDNGLFEIIRTAVTDPGFLLSQSFNEDKLIFFVQMFMPLAFLPFLSKKGGHFLLLAPTFLVCMLPDYEYQHSIDFQYVFGMVPMLFYLSVLNAKELGRGFRKYALPFMAMASITLSFSHITDKVFYLRAYQMDREKLDAYETYLSMIPEEASVECTHIFVPRLSSRLEVYSIQESAGPTKWEPCDYVVMKVGAGEADYVQEKIAYLTDNGYSYAFGDPDYIAVYHLDSADY